MSPAKSNPHPPGILPTWRMKNSRPAGGELSCATIDSRCRPTPLSWNGFSISRYQKIAAFPPPDFVPYAQLRCGVVRTLWAPATPCPSSGPRVVSALLGHTMRKGLRVEERGYSVCDGRQSLLNILFMVACSAQVTANSQDEALRLFRANCCPSPAFCAQIPLLPVQRQHPLPNCGTHPPACFRTRVSPRHIEGRARAHSQLVVTTCPKPSLFRLGGAAAVCKTTQSTDSLPIPPLL
ncbi:hypothetical protein C8R46DRAFT_513659 [Mycena filopes]|nr:hypothetical protein C8R46DRAFT_513659 [Mycena filopes]